MDIEKIIEIVEDAITEIKIDLWSQIEGEVFLSEVDETENKLYEKLRRNAGKGKIYCNNCTHFDSYMNLPVIFSVFLVFPFSEPWVYPITSKSLPIFSTSSSYPSYFPRMQVDTCITCTPASFILLSL